MFRRITTFLAAVGMVLTVSVTALPGGAAPGMVKCNANDITVDGRVFPEPRLSATFLSLSDFECGIFLLEQQHRSLIEVATLGTSASGHPLYNIRLTNQAIPDSDKRHLLVMSSIHGNEHAGREGAARVIEDMVDPRFLAREEWVTRTLDEFVVHFVFPNPDGWVNGDMFGRNDAGVNFTRQNNGPPPRDLNRNFPVAGFLRASNGTLDQPEGRGLNELLLRHADTTRDVDDPGYSGWYLGTDNHGQGVKPVAASGLQIVGQFDFQKSERLAHFADGIEAAMAEYDVLSTIQELNQATGGAIRPYEWGTLYDILGYSASGSGIDYYNTPPVINGTGFATEMTASNLPFSNILTHPGLVNQMWVDSVRAINYTMFKDAIDPPSFAFPVGGRAAYVFDPAVVASDDDNGMGPGNAPESIPANFTGDPDPASFAPYRVTRMKFFEDLNRYADQPLDAIRVPDVLAANTQDPRGNGRGRGRQCPPACNTHKDAQSDSVDLSGYDSLIVADNPMPEGDDPVAWVAVLREFVEAGGNLIVTDAAAQIIPDLFEDIDEVDVELVKRDVGYVDFGDRSHPLNANLRGVASQTWDVIPIGYPDNDGEAPNWVVDRMVWEQGGGYTAGTNGSGSTVYGERPLGSGKVTFLGALLPEPTEEFFHPYGLQSYAVTYTGYTLLENMLRYTSP